VDTGASQTAITESTLRSLGLDRSTLETTRLKTANGRTVPAQVARFQNVEFGNFTIPYIAASIAGSNLLGLDVLGRYRIILDVPKGQLKIQDATADFEPGSGAAVFPYNPRQLQIPIRVTLNGTPVNLILDTGASTTNLSPRIAAALQLPVIGTTQRTLADGKVSAARVVQINQLGVGELSLGGMTATVLDDAIGEQGSDGLLGYNFLRQFRLTLDPATGKGYLQRQ